MNVPPTPIWGEPLPNGADRMRLDHSASGWCGIHDCQPEITRLAADHGQLRKNVTSLVRLCVRKLNDVATPKLPPPPPWLAQYRSLWALVALQVRMLPSAVTISTCSIASEVRPNARASTPMPPPSARPARPTVGQEPPGTALPCAARPL